MLNYSNPETISSPSRELDIAPLERGNGNGLRSGLIALATVTPLGIVAESTRAEKVLQLPNCILTALAQRRDAVRHTVMAPSRNLEETNEKITPPSSFIRSPLTPPSTDEKPFAQAPRVIALFHEIRAGKHSDRRPWTEFLLVPGEFGRVQCLLDRDEELRGFVKDKIRWVHLMHDRHGG